MAILRSRIIYFGSNATMPASICMIVEAIQPIAVVSDYVGLRTALRFYSFGQRASVFGHDLIANFASASLL